MVILVKKKCKVCEKNRKFVQNTPRDKENTCGNCWTWTPEDLEENIRRFADFLTECDDGDLEAMKYIKKQRELRQNKQKKDK